MANSKQVAPPGEKPARRCVIPPALGEEYFPFLSFVKRPVRTRMRGVVGFLLPTIFSGRGQPPVLMLLHACPVGYSSLLLLQRWVCRGRTDL